MNCVNCGTPFAPGTRFCPSCGAQQPAPAPTRPVERLPPATGAELGGGSLPQLGAPVAPVAVPEQSGLAVVSLIAGIASYAGFTIFAAVAAVITGHMARKEIRESGGRKSGGGMALAGLILGYSHFALLCLGIAVLVLVLGVFAAKS